MKKNLSGLIQLLPLTVVVFFVSVTMIFCQADKANFAGTWTLNAEKSTIPEGSGGQRMGGVFIVSQEANLLTQTRTGQDGTTRVTKYTLDGKECVNSFGDRESKSIAKWSADGRALTIVTRLNFDGNERTSSAVWSLIDEKTLSIASARQGQDGEVKATMVYDKK
jgi:hypothetical protein